MTSYKHLDKHGDIIRVQPVHCKWCGAEVRFDSTNDTCPKCNHVHCPDCLHILLGSNPYPCKYCGYRP